MDREKQRILRYLPNWYGRQPLSLKVGKVQRFRARPVPAVLVDLLRLFPTWHLQNAVSASVHILFYEVDLHALTASLLTSHAT